MTILLCAGSFFLATEWLLQTKVVPHDHMIMRAKLFHKRPHLNTIFGDSQMRDGVNMLPGFSNFSTGSQTYPEIEAKLKAFYGDVDAPFQVIIHAAVNNFAEYRDRPDRQEIAGLFLKDGTNGPFMIQPYYQETAWRYWKNFIENDFKITDGGERFNPDGSTSRFGDFSKLSGEQQNKIMLEMIDSYRPLDDPKSLKAYAAFINIFEFLKNKNAQVCLVLMPMQKTARGLFVKDENVAQVLKIFKETARAYDLRYVDLMTDAYPDAYFDDASHLNETGAQKITQRVQSRCF